MKAPDKIYLEKSLSNPERLHSQWYPNDVIGGGIEYICKDALMEKISELRAIPHDNAIARDNAFVEIINIINSIK